MLHYQRANTRDVLDAQKDLFKAKNAATASLVDYTIATLDFYRDSGVLEVRPDGMLQEARNIAKAEISPELPVIEESFAVENKQEISLEQALPDLYAIKDLSISESKQEKPALEAFIKQWVKKAGRNTQ